MTPIWIIGAGGHAKVAIDAARASGGFDVRGCLDDRWAGNDEHVEGVPVLGPVTEGSLTRHGVDTAIIAIGHNDARRRIAERFAGLLTWATIVHPAAVIAPSATIGPGTLICAGVVVQPDTLIGDHVIVNTSSSIDHDGNVENFAHIGPGVHLAGNVRVETGAFLGIGAVVIPGRVIGAWSTVGAGGVVTRDVPPQTTVVGVPAKPLQAGSA